MVVRAVVELGGAGALMSGHRLGVFQRAAIVEIGGDAGGAEGVITDRRRNIRIARAALQHAPGVGLRHRAISQNAGAPDRRAKQRPIAIIGNFGGLEVVLQVSLEMVVAGHAVFLAAFFVEANPEAAVLPVDVRHRHAERRPDAGERENQ